MTMKILIISDEEMDDIGKILKFPQKFGFQESVRKQLKMKQMNKRWVF